jgi:hypothetical protein
MKIKTKDLIGAALDWAVSRAEGVVSDDIDDFCMSTQDEFNYSANWELAGPIIEREGIDLFTEKGTPKSWVASVARHQKGQRLDGWRLHVYGPTPLIAAMRCFTASRLGREVDIPEELSR